MARQPQILHVDNMKGWLEFVGEELDKKGKYKYHLVETLRDARYELLHSLYHILLLDINFDESNTADDQGIQFLKELASLRLFNRREKAFAIVMFSSDKNSEWMRVT